MKQAYQGLPLAQVTRSFLRGSYSREMTRKLLTRVRERIGPGQSRDPMPWILSKCEALNEFGRSVDEELWQEALRICQSIRTSAEEKLKTIDIDLGGGGNFPLLYLMVRKLRPLVVIETGVAAGFSSSAILHALQYNSSGRLYSSDLPYFRINNPEQYIGFVVENSLKSSWTCLIRGDRHNLPHILSQINLIDVFHYDSDKSYSGRAWTLKLILPRMRKGGVIIMDDLNDNCFFEDFCTRTGAQAHVFEFQGKYVGLLYIT